MGALPKSVLEAGTRFAKGKGGQAEEAQDATQAFTVSFPESWVAELRRAAYEASTERRRRVSVAAIVRELVGKGIGK